MSLRLLAAKMCETANLVARSVATGSTALRASDDLDGWCAQWLKTRGKTVDQVLRDKAAKNLADS